MSDENIKVKAIDTGDGEILVQTIDVEIPKTYQSRQLVGHKGLPPGATPVSANTDNKTWDMLESHFRAFHKMFKQSLKENKPDEVELELNVGFASEGGIPVLLSGKVNGGIKVKAKWKLTD